MEESRLLILDCKGAVRPIVRFNLEIAGFATCVVTDKEEAVNQLDNAVEIDRGFSCLLVNDYDPARDPSVLLELCERSRACEAGCQILFVSRSDLAQGLLAPLAKKFSQLNIHVCQPAQVVGFLTSFREAS